jgi:DNA-binding NarL/FixJ family response regulator
MVPWVVELDGLCISTALLQVSLDIDAAAKVVVFGLSTDREPEIVACAEAGVAGLHLRSESFAHLLELVSNASTGGAQCSSEVSAILLRRVYSLAHQPATDSKADLLTAREIEILDLIELGLTNQQIASRLSLALHTVKNHVHSLLTKLGVSSRAEAVTVFVAEKYA